MFPSLAFLHAYPLTSMHTRTHMHTYIFCGPGLEECWVSLQPPPLRRLGFTTLAPLTSFHSKVCPLRAATFLSEPGDCDRFAKWHTYTNTHIYGHTRGHKQRGGCSVQGGTRERWAPAIKPSEDEARVLPWTGQYFLPLCQDAVRTGSRRASDMNDIYKAAVCPHSKHIQLKECNWLPLAKLFDLLGAHQNTVRTNLVWEWCFYGSKTIILNIS